MNPVDGNLGDVSIDPPETIPASAVTERVMEVASDHPNKHVLIHYFQPHAPCIGRPDGAELEEPTGRHPLADEFLGPSGDISYRGVWKSHCDNLAYAWHHARRY